MVKCLVDQLSASNDYEKLMISKLKVNNLPITIFNLHFTLFSQETCAFEHTPRFERMVQDVDVSKNLIDEYQTYCQNERLNDVGKTSILCAYFKRKFCLIFHSQRFL